MNTERRDDPIPVSVAERMIALETRIAYQDHLLATLDEVVRDFASRVEGLERVVHELRQAAIGMPDVGPPDQLPPHY